MKNKNKPSVQATLPGKSRPQNGGTAFIPPDADILPPSDDRIFKALLTHPDAERVLIDIVSAVIERKVVSVQVRNIEPPKMDTEEKAERFDVNCTVENGDQVDVEMHCSAMEEIGFRRANFVNKYVYYLTDLHSSQRSKGKKYHELARTYQATFSKHTVFPKRKNFVSRFSLREENGEQISDQINMVIVELSKLKEILAKPVEEMSAFEMWSLFLKYAQDPVHREKINDIMEAKEEIGMAASLLRKISKDERERAINRSRRMYETDMVSNILTAEERGERRERRKWRAIIAENKAAIADKDKIIARLQAELKARSL